MNQTEQQGDARPKAGLRVNIAIAAMKAILSNPSCFAGSHGPTDPKSVHDIVKDSFAFADEMLRRHHSTRTIKAEPLPARPETIESRPTL